MLLRELTENNVSEGCYLIRNQQADFFVIHEKDYREVYGGVLYDLIKAFFDGTISWNSLCSKLIYYKEREMKNKEHQWFDFDDKIKDKVIDIDSIYVNGEKYSCD